jgi:hypothetical protein
MRDALISEGIFNVKLEGGHTADGQHISFGAAPCSTSAVEYAVYCASCGQPMNEEAHKIEVM